MPLTTGELVDEVEKRYTSRHGMFVANLIPQRVYEAVAHFLIQAEYPVIEALRAGIVDDERDLDLRIKIAVELMYTVDQNRYEQFGVPHEEHNG